MPLYCITVPVSYLLLEQIHSISTLRLYIDIGTGNIVERSKLQYIAAGD